MPRRAPIFKPQNTQTERDRHRQRQRFRRHDEWQKFYKSKAWRAHRDHYLAHHSTCVACKAAGIDRVAERVDHITPARDGGDVWNWSNLQALCVSCHNRKTAYELNAKRRNGEGRI